MKMPSREWLRKKIESEPEGEIGVGFESAFVDASEFVDYLKQFIKPAHDPETQKNDPNIYRYEDDK